MISAETRDPGPRRKRWVSILGFVIGVALLAGALIVVGSRWHSLREQWGAGPSTSGRWGLVLAVVALPAVNWLLTSASFWVVTNRYGRVRFAEMGALIATASLLNYLPLRPGLLGRVAYHRAVNGIPVWVSVKVLVALIGCTGAAAALLLGVTALAGQGAGAAVVVAAVAAPAAALAGVWAMGWSRDAGWACYASAGMFRYLDMIAWAGRYAAAFALWGSPIGPGPATVLAAVSQAATLVPLAGNGLGLREWGTGYTAAWLAAGGVVLTGGAGALDLGLAADLVNRAGELAALVPIGIVGWFWILRRLGGLGLNSEGSDGADNPTRTEQHPRDP